MRTFSILLVLISCLTFLPLVAVKLPRHTQPERLPLQAIAWSWRDEMEVVRIVDLDADERDEVIFCDWNSWWWAEWDGQAMTPQKDAYLHKSKGSLCQPFGFAIPNPIDFP